jgi:hypothetical protein
MADLNCAGLEDYNRQTMGGRLMSHPLVGKRVVAMAANYIYTGELEEHSIDRVVLGKPSIVYETGPWSDSKWKDEQRLPTNRIHIERSAVESLFELIREAKK